MDDHLEVSENALSANPSALEVRRRFDELMEGMPEYYEQGAWDAQIVAFYLVQEVRRAVLASSVSASPAPREALAPFAQRAQEYDARVWPADADSQNISVTLGECRAAARALAAAPAPAARPAPEEASL